MNTCCLCRALQSELPALRLGATPRGEFVAFDCERCGEYELDMKLQVIWGSNGGPQAEDALRLSGLARTMTDRSETLRLTSSSWQKISEQDHAPLTFTAYVDRFLRYVAEKSKFPGGRTPPERIEAYASRLFLPLEAFIRFLGELERISLVVTPSRAPLVLSVLPQGWARVDDLLRQGQRGTRAFVAMAFSSDLKDAYDIGIRPALTACGYDGPFRVDDPEHESAPDYQPRIDDRIMAEIRRARFLVVDITGARQAVYFEAGFAMGLGLPIVWTGRQESFDRDKTFDTQQFGHIVWSDPGDLRDKLEARVRARGWALK